MTQRRPMLAKLPLPHPRVIRQMLIPDMNRLLSDYLTHYRPMLRNHHKDIYSVGMQKRFARLAKNNKVLIATNPAPEAQEAKRDILGWIMFKRWQDEALIVHYLYVRAPFREQGLARELLAAAGYRDNMPIVATHRFRLDRKQTKRYQVAPNEFLLEEISEWQS